jgi:hypothetical protein
MSNAQGIRAGRAYVELFADGRALAAGLTAAGQRLRQFGAQVRAAGIALGLAGAALMAPFAASIKAYVDAARDGKLAGADLAKAVDLQSAINGAKNAILGLEVAIGSDLAPALTMVAKLITSTVDKVKEWVRANPGAAATIGLVSAAVAGLGIALVGLGITIQITAFAFAGLGAAASASLGALISPITLAAAAVAGLGYVLTAQTEIGRDGLRLLGEEFGAVADDAKAAWGGIGDAMASGDLGLAAQIALKLVQMEFTRAWQFIKELTLSLLVGIQKGFIWAGEKIASVISGIMSDITKEITAVITLAKSAAAYSALGNGAIIAYTGEALGALPKGTTDILTSDGRSNIEDVNSQGAADRAAAAEAAAKRISDIEAQANEMRGALTDGLANVIVENDGAIAEMRAQLDELRNTARTAREGMEREAAKRGDAIKEQMAPVGATKADVFGTFSAAASFGIGIGSTAADRTAKASEQAAKELKEINGKFDKITSATFIP